MVEYKKVEEDRLWVEWEKEEVKRIEKEKSWNEKEKRKQEEKIQKE